MPTKPTGIQARVFKNGIYSALSWVFPIIFAVIVTPIVVRGLGNELYGLYAVILGFISYSFTFGIGKTAAKYVAEYKATGETDKISETVSAALWLSLGIGILGAALVALSANYIISNVLLIPSELHDTAVTALYLAGLTILMTMLSQVFQSVLQGLQRFDRFVFLTNLSVFLLNLGSVFIVIEGYRVLALLGWNLIVAIAIGAAFYLNARRLLPEFEFTFRIRPELRNIVFRYGGNIIIYQIFSNLFLLFERAWIVRNFGSEALTFYVVPMTLGIYLHGFIASIVLVLFPVVNELLAEREKLVRLYHKSTRLILFIIVFALTTTIVSGKIFLAVWMKSDDFAVRSYSILVIHITTFAILAAMTIVWHITESFKRSGVNVLAVFLWMAISIPLMIILSTSMQTDGVAVARLIGVFVFIPLILYTESRFLGRIFWSFWVSVLWKIAVAAGASVIVEKVIFSWIQPGWPCLIIGGAAGGVVYVSVILAVGYFSNDDRNMVMKLIFRKDGAA